MPAPPGLLRAPSDRAIADAAEAIRRGELVGMPTETVYGLAANALDDAAVARVFEAKGRPRFDPLIVHAADRDHARRYAAVWTDTAQRLAEAFWPGPLTLVTPKRTPETDPAAVDAIGDLVTAGLPSVALRVPAHDVARRLIRAAGVPLAAPSANRFGRVSPTRPDHVADELAHAVAIVLDGGPCATGVESTVVSCTEPARPRVLRLGGVPLEALENALGHELELAAPDRASPEDQRRGRASPGMLERHYAPATPLRLCDTPLAEACHAARREGLHRIGILRFSGAQPDAPAHPGDARVTLSDTGDLAEAAARLFAAMRELDAADVQLILAEPAPERGLGRAINDRLRRAAQRSP